MLTKRRKQVLDFIKKYMDKYEYAPALEEIKNHFHLASVSTAHYHVQALQKLGFLHKEVNQPRALDVFSTQKLVQIPLLGRIAAGAPIEAIEDTKENIAVPKDIIKSNNKYFALKVTGKSMVDENIDDGDIVIVKQQNTASNGDRVVALLENRDVTLKRFHRERGGITLKPANPDFKSIFLRSDELAIQGIVVDVIKQGTASDIEINDVLPKTDKGESKSNTEKEYLHKWLNTVQCMDCVEGMKKLPDNSIDLVVTSPPYDGIRKYNGFNYNLHATGQEIFRILKDGGIATMVIQDQTQNFGKTLTSFKTIVDWCDSIGFKLFECVIYRKYGPEGAWWKSRFRVDHEYMPIFLKGDRPQYFNKEPLKIPSKHAGKIMTGSGSRRTDGKTNPTVTRPINPTKCRGTIWDYLMAGDKDPLKRKHPAPFPDKIPIDFIQCFCPENGIVLDPFMGCGSTAVSAKKLKRNFIGFELSKEYCELVNARLKKTGDYLI